MKHNIRGSLLALLAGLFGVTAGAPSARAGEGPLTPTYLRCESLVDPLGLSETKPRLSWQLESGLRAQRQAAFEILVGSDAALLTPEQADLWKTGKVAGDQTFGIVYAGKSLVSNQACVWKVRVWNQAGDASAWSKPAAWSVGLLKTEQWRGDWIGYDKHRATPVADAPFDGAKWIWHA